MLKVRTRTRGIKKSRIHPAVARRTYNMKYGRHTFWYPTSEQAIHNPYLDMLVCSRTEMHKFNRTKF